MFTLEDRILLPLLLHRVLSGLREYPALMQKGAYSVIQASWAIALTSRKALLLNMIWRCYNTNPCGH